MARHYPRIGERERPKRDESPCGISGCKGRPVGRVTIQVTWFRGDDEIAKVCREHLRLLELDLLRVLGYAVRVAGRR